MLEKARLPQEVRDAAESARAKSLLSSIDHNHLLALLSVAPASLLAKRIDSLRVPARVKAVCARKRIVHLGDLLQFDEGALGQMPGLGRRSLLGLKHAVVEAIEGAIPARTGPTDTWLVALGEKNPALGEIVARAGIFSDAAFLSGWRSLGGAAAELHRFRFSSLAESIDRDDPTQVLPLLPPDVLAQPITALCAGIRAERALAEEKVSSIGDLVAYTPESLRMIKRIGQSTVRQIARGLLRALADFADQLQRQSVAPTLRQSLTVAVHGLSDRRRDLIQKRLGLGVPHSACKRSPRNSGFRGNAPARSRRMPCGLWTGNRSWVRS